MKDEFKVIGALSWQGMRESMIQKLQRIRTEKEFGEFIKIIACSIGTVEEIKEQRKRLGLKPLTKDELKEIEDD